MKALVAPDHQAAFRYYEEIVAAKKNGARVSHLHGRISAAYSSYWQHQPALERLSPLPGLIADEKEVLEGLYNSESRAVAPLKKVMHDIKKAQGRNEKATCQHCGIGEPNTFDHYLPKHVFQEFSVCSLNLVPCCGICNGKRGERPWCQDGERSSLHLYFDEIEVNRAYVEADVVPREHGGFRVKYRLDEASTDDFARRYRRHCKTLGLLERFEARASGKLDGIRVEIINMKLGSVEAVAERFQSQALAWTTVLGANNWEVALQHAVSRAHDFIAHTLEVEPPHG